MAVLGLMLALVVGVDVESLFDPADRGAIGHEYQCDFAVAEALACSERTMAFLDTVVVARGVGGR
jgi:hypothetical protein